MFTGIGRFKRDRFPIKWNLGDGLEWCYWNDIKKDHSCRHQFETYKIQTVEVEGQLSEIVDLFVKINSTGKRLTSGEKRHAKYYNSPFLKEADRLVATHRKYVIKQKILSKNQLDRMKGTELFAELLMSIHNVGPINKKTSLDRAIANESINGNTLNKLSREFVQTINALKKMFPDIRHTRFHNTVEFYSLFLLVWEMIKEGFVVKDMSRARIAFAILKRLSNGVDQLREQLNRVKPVKRSNKIFSDYLLSVQSDTDSASTRGRRREILRALIFPLYVEKRKDQKRLFSPEQRRLIWNKEDEHICSECKKPLTWDDFTIDHIIAHVKGGKTSLKNARVICRDCNSRKGGR